MICILISGKEISGAEKRALSIYVSLLDSKRNVVLLVNSSLKKTINESRQYTHLQAIQYRHDLNPFFVLFRVLDGFQQIVNQKSIKSTIEFFINKLDAIVNRNLYRIIKKNKIEILHIFMDKCIPLKGDLCIVYDIVGPLFAQKIKKWPSSRIERVSHYRAVSPSVALKTDGFISEHKLSVSKYPFSNTYSHFQISEIELKKNAICFAHRFIDRKNGVLFAQVARKFVINNPGWMVYILGKGKYEQEILEILKHEIKLGKVIVKFESDISIILKNTKIFVSLNSIDNYPSQSVLESMFYGNALLLTDCGSTRDKFFNNNGILCDFDEIRILKALCSLCENEVLLREYCINSFNTVRNWYPPENYIHDLISLYGSLKNA